MPKATMSQNLLHVISLHHSYHHPGSRNADDHFQIRSTGNLSFPVFHRVLLLLILFLF